MVLLWIFSQSMTGAGLGGGCCALAVPADSAAAAASATSAIRFLSYTCLFFWCGRPAFSDRRETAPPPERGDSMPLFGPQVNVPLRACTGEGTGGGRVAFS